MSFFAMASAPLTDQQRRAVACFQALAIGDALGKQTEALPFRDVRMWYPEGVRGFEGVPGDVIPRYKGKRYEWRIGETTDDTEQTLAVARAALRDRTFSHVTVGQELLRSVKSVHPGVAMWPFVEANDRARVAADGDGCGAAMRVSPVGLMYRPNQIDGIIRAAYECSIPTHGGQSAICAAAAVAAAVSASLEGCSRGEVLAAALRAATVAESLRPPTRPHSIGAALAEIHADLSAHLPLTPEYIADRYFPATPETKTPLAISLALITESAERTALLAANAGGDADSVASMGAAIAGALRPDTVKREWHEIVSSVNDDDVVAAALALVSMRE
ncbi:MAG TPA: ADP-ribosylglycohydrolase family protein [Candidatus Acidoferrales bacterium]|nr:ADP-ribosylglycohydrolase family protein [Candidatus Acidoferrales bacterium]